MADNDLLAIGDIVALTEMGVTAAQLRHWDAIGIVPALNPHSTHRRYGIAEIRRLIAVMALILEHRSPAHIRAVLETVEGQSFEQQTKALRDHANKIRLRKGIEK